MGIIPVLQSIYRRARLDTLARIANRRRLLIVTYHGVREDSSATRNWLLLPQSEFIKQLEYLDTHYEVVPLDDAVRDHRQMPPPRARACITFDDGYRNNFELVLPVLQQRGLPATIFLPTALIGGERLLWTTQLELGLRRAGPAAHAQVAKWLGVARFASPDQLIYHACEKLKTLPPETRDALLEKVYEMLPTPSAEQSREFAFLKWDEVQAMEATRLVTFGAHTANHEIVRNLDDARLRVEIATSIAEIARHCERPSRVFAYPNGRRIDFDDRAIRILRELGCIAAVSTIEGLNNDSVPPYALRRVSVGAEMGIREFRSRVSGLDSQVRGLIRAPN